MLECQRNGESSFAVSASTCIRRNNGGCEGVRRGSGGKGSRGKDARRARTWVCSGAVCRAHSCDLQLMKLRVQSRRMSNKYVSRHPLAATPVHTVVHLRSAPGPVIPTPSCTTTYPLHPLPSQPLPLPLAASPCRSSSPFFARIFLRAPDRQPTPPPPAHFNPLVCSFFRHLSPIHPPFRLQDGLIRNEIIAFCSRVRAPDSSSRLALSLRFSRSFA